MSLSLKDEVSSSQTRMSLFMLLALLRLLAAMSLLPLLGWGGGGAPGMFVPISRLQLCGVNFGMSVSG